MTFTLDMRLAALSELIQSRQSCRSFTSETVSQEVIENVLRLAQRTASWCNTQPWSLFVSSGENVVRLKVKLLDAAQNDAPSPDIAFPPQYKGEHLNRRRAAGFQLYDAAGIERGDRDASKALALKNFELFGAPHLVVVTAPRYLGSYALVDCGGWVANFLLVAHAHGLSAIPQAALAHHAGVLREHFSIKEDLNIICGISFGFEQTNSPLNSYRTNREMLPAFCSWHKD